MPLNKADVLASQNDVPVHRVETPEWGGDGFVFVRRLTGSERDAYDQLQQKHRFPTDEDGEIDQDKADWRGLRAGLVALGMCDQNGKTEPYTEAELVALGNTDGAALDRVYLEIRERSGLSPKAKKEAEKN